MQQSQSYYFPVLSLIPDFDEVILTGPKINIIKRLWDTSIFDLATLATKHRLHMPYQLMDVFFKGCNLEICIKNENNTSEAISRFCSIRIGLYTEGVSPFYAPFYLTHSVNEYSGINSRDSELLIQKLPNELQHGIKSEDASVEGWPFEVSLSNHNLPKLLKVTEKQFLNAIKKSEVWQKLQRDNDALIAVSSAINASPLIISRDQSFLQLWCGLEALFPNVNTELNFKIAMYLTELAEPSTNRVDYFKKVQKSYNLRSQVIHGSKRNISINEWEGAWQILMDIINSIISAEKLRNEKELFEAIISRGVN